MPAVKLAIAVQDTKDGEPFTYLPGEDVPVKSKKEGEELIARFGEYKGEGPAATNSADTKEAEKLQKENAALKKKNAEMTSQLAEAEFRASIPDAQRTHYDGLSDEDKTAFHELDEAEREAAVGPPA